MGWVHVPAPKVGVPDRLICATVTPLASSSSFEFAALLGVSWFTLCGPTLVFEDSRMRTIVPSPPCPTMLLNVLLLMSEHTVPAFRLAVVKLFNLLYEHTAPAVDVAHVVASNRHVGGISAGYSRNTVVDVDTGKAHRFVDGVACNRHSNRDAAFVLDSDGETYRRA